MSPLDALYNTVHDAEGGVEVIAMRLGKRPGTLRHELRPPEGSTAKAGLLDAVKIMEITRDMRTLHAMATSLGHMAVPLPQLDRAHDELMLEVSRVAEEFAGVMAEVSADATHATISDNDMARIEEHWSMLLAAGCKLVGHFAQMNQEAKTARGVPMRRVA